MKKTKLAEYRDSPVYNMPVEDDLNNLKRLLKEYLDLSLEDLEQYPSQLKKLTPKEIYFILSDAKPELFI